MDVGGPAANASFHLAHDGRRWVLATWGDGWGTAVLYWSQLIVLLAVAVGLSKLPNGLFSLRTALLLVLGFSTLPGTVFWLGALVGWVAWGGWRGRLDVTTLDTSRFHLGQMGLLAMTAITVLGVVIVIGYGLLGAQPDMMLRAPPGVDLFTWLQDRVPAGPLAGPTVLSLPLWVYQLLLLALLALFAFGVGRFGPPCKHQRQAGDRVIFGT